MSMYRQLWLAIILSTLLALVGSLLASTLSSRSYLNEQLRMKNADNATVLALSLSQKNIDAVELEFAPGFTVFTGETGAGKSILIDALALALGGRGDASVVREGAAKADITAEFSTGDDAAAWLAANEFNNDEGGGGNAGRYSWPTRAPIAAER